MVSHVPPLTFGPGAVDWQHRIDTAELRRQRAARARQVLKERGVAAVLVAGPLACRYLTGLRGPEYTPEVWFVLFPAEGEPVVFAHAGYIRSLPDEAPWIHEWRIARAWLRGIAGTEASKHEAAKFADDVRAELQQLQLLDEPLGVAGFDRYARPALVDAGIKIIPGDDVLLDAMAVKTPEELSCLRMAGTITDRMWVAMERACRAGMTDGELSSVGKSAASSAGADSVKAGFRSGQLALERGFKSNQFIVPGDLMYGNVCGTSYLGYRTCVYRTFTVGREPTKQEIGWMDRLQGRLLAVIEELRPGAMSSTAAKHFPPATEWGYADEVEVLTIEIGHGIGLNGYEQPAINRQWSMDHPQPIKEGMVIAVEGREGIPGQGTVRLEQMVIVTKDGPQLIDRYPTGIKAIG
ncbi:MAG: M24 family metallopeptidase [Nitriliruptorales bacterium]|nr:M24 family metallopeptidase [Nitriliruptorales bacterium]